MCGAATRRCSPEGDHQGTERRACPVDELPREEQSRCARLCTLVVDAWEERSAEPPMSGKEWERLRSRRTGELTARVLKKLRGLEGKL